MIRVAGRLAVLSFFLLGARAWSDTFNLQGLSQDDYGKIVDDFSADFSHTSVSGASSLGHIFGFEFGVVGGSTRTPNVNRIVHESDPTADASKLPMGELLGVLTVPAGITAELGLIPKVGSQDFHFNSLSMAVKWTATELLELPFSLAVKGHVTGYKMESKGTVNVGGTDTAVSYKYTSTITGLTVLASKDFMIAEPYAGVGILSAKGDMDASGVNDFVQGSTSASAKRTSTEFMLGAELKLAVVKLGAEYGHLFGTNRFAGKLSFFF